MIEAMLNYLAPMKERPVFYLTEPPPGTSWRNTKGDRQVLPIHDARQVEPAPSLDCEGFSLISHQTQVQNLYDHDAIRADYYPEMERLVADFTGASRVVAFDHNVRCAPMSARNENEAQNPVLLVHNDYTLGSAPQRVRDLIQPAEEAEALLEHRFSIINVWKPITGPVEESPLAFCSADSMQNRDFIPTSLEYADRTGEIYSLRHNPEHRWYYYPDMKADEAMLLKCYDSDPDVACFTAHSAVEDPTSPADAKPRESIEVRTLVFYAPV